MKLLKKKVLISMTSIFSILSIIFYIIIPKVVPFSSPCDVDYISKGEYAGNYIVSQVWGYIIIIDKHGNVKWHSQKEEFFVHDSDILPNGNILVADTQDDRVVEIDIHNSSRIVWSWDAMNSSDVNWTKFALDQGWTDLSFLEDPSPLIGSWTHLNDVDFINGSKYGKSYDSVLISLRNLNLVIEVNYSNTKEIVWSYGQPHNLTLLNHQHNPDRYDNGNTVICDTRNDRIIEVNTSTKEVVWEFKLEFPHGRLRLARDCDDIGNGKRMITDSGNNRLLFYDMYSGKIIKEIKSPWFANPYDADMLENGRIIVTNLLTDTILFIDYNSGLVIRIIGFPYKWVVPYILIISAIGYHCFNLFKAIKSSEKRKLKKIFDFQVHRRLVYISCGILSLYFFNSIISFLWIFIFRL
ncbi:MAG: aryl-sulfate sulfotransferase [Promethearchaeota archaeon]